MLDASALTCLVNVEPGAARVAAVLPRAVVSAVNIAEVAAKLNELEADAEAARALLAPLHLTVVPLDEGTALAAERCAATRATASLGDRTCLSLAAQRSATALTTDLAWSHSRSQRMTKRKPTNNWTAIVGNGGRASACAGARTGGA